MSCRMLVLAIPFVLATELGYAQDLELRLRNTGGQEKVEFLYRSVSERNEPLHRVTLIGKGETLIKLEKDGDYDVMVCFPRRNKSGTIHTCFSKPVPLAELAKAGAVIDLRSVPAADKSGATQITAADIGVNGKTIPVIWSPAKATAFAKKTLTGKWNSTYVAIDGSMQRSRDDFETLIMEGTGFRGQMSDVLAVESDDGIYLVGRWSVLGDDGDFYLFIDRKTPTELKGHYTQDGDENETKYDWSAIKVP